MQILKLLFENLDPRFQTGMAEFLKWHTIAQQPGGCSVHITITGNKKLRVVKNKNQVDFYLDRPYQVFRAVTLLKERVLEENFSLEEPCFFDTCGAMFDGSQASSLLKRDACKKLLLILAGMGFNMMMLYCEDCYSVEGEPYWGNMRPRFTPEDFRALDDYADALGIEMIPCIQTLGHLKEAIKRPPYKRLSDTKDVLLVGDEAVYALIDKLIGTVSACFRSKRIHLGLDEAWMLGLGNYRKRHGVRSQEVLMQEHVARVYEIVQRRGLTPMMWSDMYFRAKSNIDEYYDPNVQFAETDKQRVPQNMGLIYWDYYHTDPSDYADMIDRHRMLGGHLIFAGSSRSTRTFASFYNISAAATNAALAACKQKGVREVFATVWGDDHREGSTFAALPGLMLYAEHMYAKEPDMARLPQRFFCCTGVDWDAFMDIDRLDCMPSYNGENLEVLSLTRACLWQDVLLGLCDKDLGDASFSSHYSALKEKLKASARRYPAFEPMFTFYSHLANVLETKADLGRQLTTAYRNNNFEELKRMAGHVLPKLSQDLQALRKAHRRHFFDEYKPVGWEILDIRYGGAIMRIDTAMERVLDYVTHKIDKIDELEEERLSFSGTGRLRHGLNYQEICSASSL